MTEESKSPEVTFKYFLPENQDELWMHYHASDMYMLIHEIDQVCRSLIKHGDQSIKTTEELAEKIREMIYTNIDMDRVR